MKSTLSPTARDAIVAGVTADNVPAPEWTSLTDRSDKLTLPVFVTLYVYVTISPTLRSDVISAVFVMDASGAGPSGVTDSSAVAGVSVPPAGVASAVAVFVISIPASISACVTT